MGHSAQLAGVPKQLVNEDEEQALILYDHWQTKVREGERESIKHQNANLKLSLKTLSV